jgi:hypothetical protein
LRDGAAPFFKLFDRENSLRIHNSYWPGDHNFGIDNRQALYRMLGDFFYASDKNYNTIEIAHVQEIKNREELDVPLPADNLDMNSLAKSLIKNLPRDGDLPNGGKSAIDWQTSRRQLLADTLRIKPGMSVHSRSSPEGEPKPIEKNVVKATFHSLKVGEKWTVPAVELVKGEPKGTTIVIADKGRASATSEVERLLAAGQRVIAVDLYDFGEGRPKSHGYLWALMLATIGERSLGLQVNELISISNWARKDGKTGVSIVADGPRSSVIALAAAAIDNKGIRKVEVIAPLGSLKEIVETNRAFDQSPELFCFGLLEQFDVKHLAALAAPQTMIVIRNADERAKKEFAFLKDWYRLFGLAAEPIK